MTAPSKRPSNPLSLAVLGLLLMRPMHPYEMATALREQHLDRAFKITTGSLYDVIAVLQRHDWIAAQETVKEGRRPERTVYALTESGSAEFVHWLDELLRTPAREYPRFLAAVSYLGALGPDAAAAALDARADQLETLITDAQSTLDGVIESEEAPRLFVIEVEYQLHMWRAELEWVRGISSEIGAGTLGWPTARMRGGRQVWVDPARAKPRGRKAKNGER